MGLVNKRKTFWFSLKLSCGLLAAVFTLAIVASDILRVKTVYAGALELPAPNSCLELSPNYEALQVYGISFPSDNPFEMDFLIDTGNSNLNQEQVKNETANLIEYFLAALAIESDDLWVNLSPYEADRIAPEVLSSTALGRDLVAQDYILKQLTASLTNPLNEIGKEYWSEQSVTGSTALNKIWIVPEIANLVEKDNNVLINNSKLKLVHANDYAGIEEMNLNTVDENLSYNAILPALTKELNQGKHFSKLRQIYQILILATWFKKRLKSHIFNKQYSDQNKTDSITLNDKSVQEEIYQNYLKSSKEGVYKIIRKEKQNNKTIKKQYFSGGFVSSALNKVLDTSSSSITRQATGQELKAKVNFRPNGQRPYDFDSINDALNDVMNWTNSRSRVLQAISETMGWVNFEFVPRKLFKSNPWLIMNVDTELNSTVFPYDYSYDPQKYTTSQTVRIPKDLSFLEFVGFARAFEKANGIERKNDLASLIVQLESAAAYIEQVILKHIPEESKFISIKDFLFNYVQGVKKMINVYELPLLDDQSKQIAQDWIGVDEAKVKSLIETAAQKDASVIEKFFKKQKVKWIQNTHHEFMEPYRRVIDTLATRTYDKLSDLEHTKGVSLEEFIAHEFKVIDKLSREELVAKRNEIFLQRETNKLANLLNKDAFYSLRSKVVKSLRIIFNKSDYGIFPSGAKKYIKDIERSFESALEDREAYRALLQNLCSFRYVINYDKVLKVLSNKSERFFLRVFGDYISALKAYGKSENYTDKQLKDMLIVQRIQDEVAKFSDNKLSSLNDNENLAWISQNSKASRFAEKLKAFNEINLVSIIEKRHMECVLKSFTAGALLKNLGFDVYYSYVKLAVDGEIGGHVCIVAQKDGLSWIVDPNYIPGTGIIELKALKNEIQSSNSISEIRNWESPNINFRHRKLTLSNFKQEFIASILNNLSSITNEQETLSAALRILSVDYNVINEFYLSSMGRRLLNSEPQRALKYFNAALNLDPQFTEVYPYKANALRSMFKYYDSLRTWQKFYMLSDRTMNSFSFLDMLQILAYPFNDEQIKLINQAAESHDQQRDKLRKFFDSLDWAEIKKRSDATELKQKSMNGASSAVANETKTNFRPNWQLPYRFNSLEDALSDVLDWDLEAQEILQTISEVLGWVNFEFVDRDSLGNGAYEIIDEDKELETIAMQGYDNLGDDNSYETTQTVRLAEDISFVETVELIKAFEKANGIERENAAEDILVNLKNAAAYLEYDVLRKMPTDRRHSGLYFFVRETVYNFMELSDTKYLEPLADEDKKSAQEWLGLNDELLDKLMGKFSTIRESRYKAILERQEKKWIQNIHYELGRPYRDMLSVLYKRSQDQLAKLNDIDDEAKTLDHVVDEEYQHLSMLSQDELKDRFVRELFIDEANKLRFAVRELDDDDKKEFVKQFQNLYLRKEESKGVVAKGHDGPHVQPINFTTLEQYLDNFDDLYHMWREYGKDMPAMFLIDSMEPFTYSIRYDLVNFFTSRLDRVSHPVLLHYIESLQKVKYDYSVGQLRSILLVNYVQAKVARYHDDEHYYGEVIDNNAKAVHESNVRKIVDNKHMRCVGKAITAARILKRYDYDLAWLEVAKSHGGNVGGHVAVYAEKDNLAWFVDPQQEEGAGLVTEKILGNDKLKSINNGAIKELEIKNIYGRHKKVRVLNVMNGYISSLLSNTLATFPGALNNKTLKLAFITLAYNVKNDMLVSNLAIKSSDQKFKKRYSKILLGINSDHGWARIRRADEFISEYRFYEALREVKRAINSDPLCSFSVKPVYDMLYRIGYHFSKLEAMLIFEMINKEINTNEELRELFDLLDMDKIKELSDVYENRISGASSAVGRFRAGELSPFEAKPMRASYLWGPTRLKQIRTISELMGWVNFDVVPRSEIGGQAFIIKNEETKHQSEFYDFNEYNTDQTVLIAEDISFKEQLDFLGEFEKVNKIERTKPLTQFMSELSVAIQYLQERVRDKMDQRTYIPSVSWFLNQILSDLKEAVDYSPKDFLTEQDVSLAENWLGFSADEALYMLRKATRLEFKLREKLGKRYIEKWKKNIFYELNQPYRDIVSVLGKRAEKKLEELVLAGTDDYKLDRYIKGEVAEFTTKDEEYFIWALSRSIYKKTVRNFSDSVEKSNPIDITALYSDIASILEDDKATQLLPETFQTMNKLLTLGLDYKFEANLKLIKEFYYEIAPLYRDKRDAVVNYLLKYENEIENPSLKILIAGFKEMQNLNSFTLKQLNAMATVNLVQEQLEEYVDSSKYSAEKGISYYEHDIRTLNEVNIKAVVDSKHMVCVAKAFSSAKLLEQHGFEVFGAYVGESYLGKIGGHVATVVMKDGLAWIIDPAQPLGAGMIEPEALDGLRMAELSGGRSLTVDIESANRHRKLHLSEYRSAYIASVLNNSSNSGSLHYENVEALRRLMHEFAPGQKKYEKDVEGMLGRQQNGGVELSVEDELVLGGQSSLIDGLFANSEYDGLEINTLSFEIVSIDAK